MTHPIQLGCTWTEAGLGADDLTQAQIAAAPLAERLELEAAVAPYAAHAWPSEPDLRLPTLLLDDVSDIPFLNDVVGVEEYQHRARVRAGDGDLFVAVTPQTPGYAEYCRDVLQLGDPEFVLAEPVEGPMRVSLACTRGSALARFTEVARAAGGLNMHPYMGIEYVWEIARKVARDANVPVKVLAPPTPITWLANDKSLLSETVARTCGEEFVVETHRSADPRRLAELLLEMKPRHARVGMKRTRCASGMGNIHFALAELSDLEQTEARVREFLRRTEWDEREEVLVVAWEDTPLSPSTQNWIPPLGAGPPRLDGIYEQLLEGAERVFVGSRPSQLPEQANRAIAQSSLRVCAALQAMGYVGRCSFDLLLVGDPGGAFKLRYVECNGRWGGTSTPMHLVDRLFGTPRPPYRAQDVHLDALAGASLADVFAKLGDDLYDARTGQGRYVVYNCNPLATSGKLDVISVGRTQEEAEELLAVGFPAKMGV